MSDKEIARRFAQKVIHPAWLEVGGNFFCQGFLFGIEHGRATYRQWLPLAMAVVFVAGFFAGWFS